MGARGGGDTAAGSPGGAAPPASELGCPDMKCVKRASPQIRTLVFKGRVDEPEEMADFGAMGCVNITPLDVALENLNLKESNKGNEPPLPPL
ncbi:E3 ubiquitin-protein ligase KCMF1 [Lemmus lemmus]